MANGELTYDDFLQWLDIQDILLDAGYHLNRRDGLRYPSYIRTDGSGTPTDKQIRGMLSATPNVNHYLCFDNDSAGREFVNRFRTVAESMRVSPDRIREFPLMPCYKDWNDALLGKTSKEYLDSIKDAVRPLSARPNIKGDEETRLQSNIHR